MRECRWIALTAALTALQLSGCGKAATPAAEENAAPAKVEHLKGPQPARVTLTAAAVQRLGIRTEEVRAARAGEAPRKSISYAAVLYDTAGDTWIYTNPLPGVYFRCHVTIDRISGREALLSDGPAVGTAVVIVGAAELYGSETEFEEE